MTLFFKNSQLTVYRERKKTNADRYAMSATYTALWSDIQPASQERTEFVSGRIGATFIAFLDTTYDIKEGDQIVIIDTGKRYAVKGVNHWQGAGLLDHIELTLTSQDG